MMSKVMMTALAAQLALFAAAAHADATAAHGKTLYRV